MFVSVWECLSSTDVADVAMSSGDTSMILFKAEGQYLLLFNTCSLEGIVLDASVYTMF